MPAHDHTHEVLPDDGGDLDPRAAAALLDQTTRRTNRELDLHPPLLMLAAAPVVLIAYGAIWLSVRGQHPYTGPSLGALAVLYGTLITFGVLLAVVTRRATSGVSGRSSQRRRGEAIAFAVVWTSVYVFQGALHRAGASKASPTASTPRPPRSSSSAPRPRPTRRPRRTGNGRDTPAWRSRWPAPAPSPAPRPYGP